MKIILLQVGKTKEANFAAILKELQKRLWSFCDLETLTIKTSNQEKENEEIQQKLENLTSKHTIIALDLRGDQMNSEEFAHWIRNERDHEGGKVAFVIGGPHGFTDQTLKYADKILSLSSMTFTHQMVRLFLLEQLYRASTILSGKSYHY